MKSTTHEMCWYHAICSIGLSDILRCQAQQASFASGRPAHEDVVRSLQSDVCARAQSDAHVSSRKRWGIIDAITNHGNHLLAALQLLHLH